MRARSGATAPLVALLPVLMVLGIGAVRTAPSEADARDAEVGDRIRQGAAVFQATCAACHGTDAAGRPGTGLEAGPPLAGVPVPYVDLVLRTGRMPIAAPQLGVRTEQLGDDDREALVAWMRERFELPGSVPAPAVGDPARGLEPFVRHCAACHGGGGVGGVAGGGTFVPAIASADPVVIVEALRVGPFEMPAFSEAVLDDRAAADIAAYLAEADESSRTVLGLEAIDPVGTAVAAAALLAAAVLLLRVVARRSGEGGPS